MNKLLNNKAIVVAGVVLVILVIVIGLVIVFNKPSSNQANQGASAYPTQVPIPSVSADSIGLALKVSIPGQKVIATVSEMFD